MIIEFESDVSDDCISISAYRHGESSSIGYMLLDDDDGIILDLYVIPDMRRHGVATAILAHARLRYVVNHSDERTTAGDAWAKSTGDSLSELGGITPGLSYTYDETKARVFTRGESA